MNQGSPISRQPLWRKVAEAITNDIASGKWTRSLPGEHQLCTHYEVGRRSIRAALLCLEENGTIRSRSGKPREIVPQTEVSSTTSIATDHVILLSPYAQDQGIAKSRILFNLTFQRLSNRGIQLVPRKVGAVSAKALDRNLGQLREQFPGAVWLLHDCSGSVQRWCHEQGERALVLGAKDDSTPFPAVEMDAESVIVQAVEQFEESGHEPTKILFLLRRDPGKNNEFANRLFQSVIQKRSAEPQVLFHNDTDMVDVLRERLSHDSPPSGLLCWRTHDAIRAVTFLTHHGVPIPRNLSVISCGSSPTMEFIHPDISRFLSPTADYERCFLRLLIQMIEGRESKPKVHRFIPEFLKGGTIAAPSLR